MSAEIAVEHADFVEIALRHPVWAKGAQLEAPPTLGWKGGQPNLQWQAGNDCSLGVNEIVHKCNKEAHHFGMKFSNIRM